MKYCTKCGNQMADDMLFCQKCGTKVVNLETEQPISQPTTQTPQPQQTYYTQPTYSSAPVTPVKKQGKIRTGMKVGMIICFVFAGLYALISIGVPFILSMTFFFLVLGIMFLLLGITPKESPYMFGKPNGLKKGIFVLISVILAFTIFGISMNILPQPETDNGTTDNGTSQSQSADTDDTKNESTENKSDKQETKTTIADVEKWYNNQTSAVSQSLMEYAKSVNGLSNLNVDSSKFRFGEDSGWYDCHYTFYFTCKINGVKHTGEARAFVKYQDNTVNWFHFEIFSNNSAQPVVEHYDDSYDKIIEEYYKELQSKYK